MLVYAVPDVNQETDRHKAALGLIGSLLIHLALGLVWLFLQRDWVTNLLVPPMKEKEALDLVIQTTAPTPPPPSEKVLLPLDQLGEKPRVD
jgi:hypothetical protein